MTDTPAERLLTYESDYLGLAEVAYILGTSQQAASNRLARGTLMEPDVRLAMGPIWTKNRVMIMVLTGGRMPRRFKRAAAAPRKSPGSSS